MKAKTDDMVHMARLGLAGKQEDLVAFVRRSSRRLAKSDPALAGELRQLLSVGGAGQIVRRATPMPLPTDHDTRLELLRCERPVVLPHEPLLPAEVKEEMDAIIAERAKEVELHEAGLQPTRTLLMTGPPGVGKTLTARWLARELNRPLFILDLAAVMSSFLGRTGSNVRAVMDYARREPSVLLLDEFDAIAKRRDDDGEIGELKRLVTVLLQSVDDWPASGLLVAATNHAELLDPAVWRRFERQVRFPIPAEEGVTAAVTYFLRDTEGIENELTSAIAITLLGRSYSDIEREILKARRDAIVQGVPLRDRLELLVQRECRALDQAARIELAVKLHRAPSISQRRAAEITGIHRSTIRSHAT